MKASSQPSIERRPSMEREPRTLSPRQLQCAREAALYIINTKTLEEAFSIFTELYRLSLFHYEETHEHKMGLQPVLSLGGDGRNVAEVGEHTGELIHAAVTMHTRQSCHRLAGVKDILSAPF